MTSCSTHSAPGGCYTPTRNPVLPRHVLTCPPAHLTLAAPACPDPTALTATLDITAAPLPDGTSLPPSVPLVTQTQADGSLRITGFPTVAPPGRYTVRLSDTHGTCCYSYPYVLDCATLAVPGQHTPTPTSLTPPACCPPATPAPAPGSTPALTAAP